MAKSTVVITITAVPPNAPPQYTGATLINDLVVGVGRQLEGFDPDGDPIAWSVDQADVAVVSMSAAGVLTALSPIADRAITVYLDDGKA